MSMASADGLYWSGPALAIRRSRTAIEGSSGKRASSQKAGLQQRRADFAVLQEIPDNRPRGCVHGEEKEEKGGKGNGV
jgi:hypothetical protein